MAEYASSSVSDGKGGVLLFPPFITQAMLDTVDRELDVRPDDVFVVTFPRSGTTWTEQIVHLLVNDGEQGAERLTDAVPWVETLPSRPGGLRAFVDAMSGRRLFTSHLPFGMMPGVSQGNGRHVYVARNPMDVAVSCFHHDRSKSGYSGTWEEHFERFMDGAISFGSYFDHVLPWWQASGRQDNILFLMYEDMQRDTPAAVAKISDFLDLATSPALVDKVVEGSSFTAMRGGTQTNFDWIPQQAGVPTHFRKGTVGDWRNQFSREQRERLVALHLERMEGTGLAFDFGEGLVLPAPTAGAR